MNKNLIVFNTVACIAEKSKELLERLDNNLPVMSNDISTLFNQAVGLDLLDEKRTARGHAFVLFLNYDKYRDPDSKTPPRVNYSANIAVPKRDSEPILKCISRVAKAYVRSQRHKIPAGEMAPF